MNEINKFSSFVSKKLTTKHRFFNINEKSSAKDQGDGKNKERNLS